MPTASESDDHAGEQRHAHESPARVPEIVEELSEHGVQDNARGVNGRLNVVFRRRSGAGAL